MPEIPLRLIDPPRYDAELADAGDPALDFWTQLGRRFEVGDCWYATPDGDAWCIFPDGAKGEPVMPIHIPDVHRRAGVRPMLAMLPGGAGVFCLHTSPSSAPNDGWTVTGELPRVTVSPSIDVRGKWHGWLQGGVLRSC